MSPARQPVATRRRKILQWLTMPALMGAGQAPRAEDGLTAAEILIGQSITLQGGKNAYGSAVMQGVKLVFDATNAGPRVNGRRLVLRTLDDDNKTALAEANARELVRGGAFMLFGSIEGGPSTAVMGVAVVEKVPFFGPMAGSPTLRRPHQAMVFPVRAEHREEFRALIRHGLSIGLSRIAFMHADSEVGRQHLENVRLISAELGAQLALALPFKSDVSDAQLDEMAQQVRSTGAQTVFNHGSIGIYEKLIRRVRVLSPGVNFFGVNSGSTQLARSLGPMAAGMVFTQVMPSPWERKTSLAREYQDAARAAGIADDFSYGGLEGYATAKALVLALRAAGPKLTRSAFLAAMNGFRADLGGMKLQYAAGAHDGSSFVDLSMVARDGRIIH